MILNKITNILTYANVINYNNEFYKVSYFSEDGGIIAVNNSKSYIDKELSEIFNFILIKLYEPKGVDLNVTSKCNYKCDMCPFHSKKDSKFFYNNPELNKELLNEESFYILNQLKSYGIKQINLTSMGEFFLWKNWESYIEKAKNEGFSLSVTTNGSLLSYDIIEFLKKNKFDTVSVSLDSIFYDKYKLIRNCSYKDFDNAMKAIDILLENGIYTHIHITLQKDNYSDINEIIDYFIDKKVNQISVSPKFIYYKNKIVSFIPVERNIPYLHSFCKALGEIFILVDGTVLGCCQMFHFYKKLNFKPLNILKNSLAECIERLKDIFIKDQIFKNYCQKCDHYYVSNEGFELAIYKKYFVKHNKYKKFYFRIPNKLTNLDDSLILKMYENNIVKALKDYL